MINVIGGAGSRGGTPFAAPSAGLKRTYLDLKEVTTPRSIDQAMEPGAALSQIPDASRTMNDDEVNDVGSEEAAGEKF